MTNLCQLNIHNMGFRKKAFQKDSLQLRKQSIYSFGNFDKFAQFQDTGDEFYLMEDKKLLCKADYDSAKAKGAPTIVHMKQLVLPKYILIRKYCKDKIRKILVFYQISDGSKKPSLKRINSDEYFLEI